MRIGGGPEWGAQLAKKKFLLQGFTARTHARSVNNVLTLDKIEVAIVSVAFANARGVSLIRQALASVGARASVFAGIRNEITTKQGLAALLELGVRLFAVDTGGRSPLYHPKLYFARNKDAARLLIGSANLTTGGLNNNIEASLYVDLDLSIPDDAALAKSIEDEFTKLPADYPQHVLRLRNLKEIVELEQSGRLIDEAASSPPNPMPSIKGTKNDKVPKIKLLVQPMGSALPGPNKIKAAKAKLKASMPTSGSPTYVLIWEMRDLARRDLTIPIGNSTHATGSINLDKGELADGVDFRHYFRDDVLANLPWKASGANIETADARFRLVVKNVDRGEFETTIRHSTSTTSASYKQRNAMTRLSWGPMQAYVRRQDLIGRSLKLYADANDNGRFLIEID